MVDRSSVHGPALRFAPVVLALALLAALGFSGPPASAAPLGVPIYSYTAEPSTTQAGAHPDLRVFFEIGTRLNPVVPSGSNQVKNALVRAPAGFVGNPHAVPECTSSQFTLDECPVDSQVGTAQPKIILAGGCCNWITRSPIYNLVPQPGQAGLYAWKAAGVAFPIYTVINARTGSDYGLDAEVKGITATFGLGGFEQILWGVPASPIHDEWRFKAGGGNAPYDPSKAPPAVSNSPERPFLTNPSSCVGPETSTLVTFAYDHGVHEKTAPWPEATGCDRLNFNPSQSALPTTSAADSASGLDIVLKVPQSDGPDTPSDSNIRGAEVRFPDGLSINSSAAEGKISCSDEQAHLGAFADEEEAECPEFSKIGTSRVDSWALPTPVYGGLYLGDPLPGDRYRIIITADGYGTHIKFAGSTKLDPTTGALTAIFKDLPQAPLTEFNMHFFGSERGLFATPEKCGAYKVESEFEAWATGLPKQNSIQFFQVTSGPGGSPCTGDPAPFKPGFRASGNSNGAGAHSPFSIQITRKDGEQTLNTIGVDTPPGFTATLKGVGKCSEQTLREIESSSWTGKEELASPKCPSGSQIGESWASAGAGSKPYYTPGKVYLSGPYKGAPLSFSVVTPVVGGPYDFGNVVNRTAVKVDPTTTAVMATSDPLPQIIDGIPLRIRSVLINLDRKDFTLNPTSCDPFNVTGILTGDEGAKAEPQSHFQVANCETLDYAPKLKTVVKGPVKRGGYPAFTATLTQSPSGEANSAKAIVTLPHSEFLAQNHIKTICTRVQFAADKCPAGSIYGHARAITPLLDEPVEGPVYMRASSNPLPDLVAALRGPPSLPIEVNLVGKIDSPNEQIRTTFSSIPDTPVSKFTLSMFGGKRGLLENSTNICTNKQKVDAKLIGQNGASANQRSVLEAPCKARKKAKKKRAAKAKRAATNDRRAGR